MGMGGEVGWEGVLVWFLNQFLYFYRKVIKFLDRSLYCISECREEE